MKIGLVLEGGGFRGVFVEGITSWLIEQNIEIPYVIGVSMGAINGTNYISKQKGRNLEILKEFINDSRYISKKNLITKGNLFDMDFIFNDIAHIHNPFDFIFVYLIDRCIWPDKKIRQFTIFRNIFHSIL